MGAVGSVEATPARHLAAVQKYIAKLKLSQVPKTAKQKQDFKQSLQKVLQAADEHGVRR